MACENNWKLSLSLFQRDAKNYIDYVVQQENEKWKATNIDAIKTKGGEFDFLTMIGSHKLSFGYAFLDDDVNGVSAILSRYTINSRKHHISSQGVCNGVNQSTHLFSIVMPSKIQAITMMLWMLISAIKKIE